MDNMQTVNICFFSTNCKLVKDNALEVPVFSLRAFINNQWEIINQWDDPGHVAKLLVKSGYKSDHLSAIKLLNNF